ncbi:MAG: acetyl-CoA carboxylase biotin carboxylase subunit [Balneolales bacterium]|nr:acetyl-CoA carboxylase biotin carboxylase subunit [Balneolales bacterium]
MPDISKVLIANRGEIAVRVIRSCKHLGIKTVAVYSEPDSSMPHVLLADEAVHIGEAASSASYLVTDKIIGAAKKTGADAIHPGYGFLSENASFAKRCREEGIIFIGPSPEAIEAMGDKTKARELMEKHGVPLPPGTASALKDIAEAESVAERIGYPVMIKAAAGGGGKGMRIVHRKEDFTSSIRTAKSEAMSAFGDDRVYVEKYLENPRHIEFQIMADTHGNVLHFFDRECSVQRRHQKVVEEAPSPFLDNTMRQDMAAVAVKVAKSCGYTGAGTVEFLADKHRNFYFLEMNTRLQVEHPVTESITGYDLVELQIKVAEGKKLEISQDDLFIKGHAIECRICAEDPAENFMPSTGYLKRFSPPSGIGVRVDEGIESNRTVSINYDPLLAKLITYGKDRDQAIRRMKTALEEFEVDGCKTTIPFCHFTMKHPVFQSGNYDTHFIGQYYKPAQLIQENGDDNIDSAAILAAALIAANSSKSHMDLAKSESNGHGSNANGSLWWTKRVR